MKKYIKNEPEQVDKLETEYILRAANEMMFVVGDFVELGCYRGDTSVLLAKICGNKKRLYLYDSFEGLPEKSFFDGSAAGDEFTKGELLVTKAEVVNRFKKSGLIMPIIKKGFFNELNSDDLPEKIAFAFLDGDLYESIRDSLKLVEDKMVEGGVILVHDYMNVALPGVSKAVDEWLKNKDRIRTSVFRTIIKIEILK